MDCVVEVSGVALTDKDSIVPSLLRFNRGPYFFFVKDAFQQNFLVLVEREHQNAIGLGRVIDNVEGSF